MRGGISTSSRGFARAFTVLYALLCVVLFALAYGAKFERSQRPASLVYWAFASPVSMIVTLAVTAAYVFPGSWLAGQACPIALRVGGLLHALALLVVLYEFSACDTSAQCAANADCAGIPRGRYAGASTEFLATLTCIAAATVCEFSLALFCDAVRRRDLARAPLRRPP